MPSSGLHTTLNVFYTAFFAFQIPIMLCIDFVTLYPHAYTPAPLLRTVADYVETYGDRLFVEEPAWFVAYTWLEVLWHLPLALYIVGTRALFRGESTRYL